MKTRRFAAAALAPIWLAAAVAAAQGTRQTITYARVSTRDLPGAGSARADLPRITRRKGAPPSVTVPGMLPLDSRQYTSGIDDISRVRAELAPGAEVRLWPADSGSDAPYVTVTGSAKRYTFSDLFLDPAYAGEKQANDNLYQRDRGYVKQDDYCFVGLALSHGALYLGVAGYSSASSLGMRGMNRVGFLLLRVGRDAQGGGLTFTPVADPPLPASGYASGAEGPPFGEIVGEPLIDALPGGPAGGDLLLLQHGRLWRRGADGAWRGVATQRALLAPWLAPDRERDGDAVLELFLRGPYLLARNFNDVPGGPQDSQTSQNRVAVTDLRTRRPVRLLTWEQTTRYRLGGRHMSHVDWEELCRRPRRGWRWAAEAARAFDASDPEHRRTL